MKIATYNINGINRRLACLLRWLAEAAPDVVCLQELKAASAEFPRDALHDAGYGAIWSGQRPRFNGVAILAKDAEPIESRRVLPGDAEDPQSRYIEAAVNGVLIGCLYAPNGNPQPGPKFDYKLAWMERFNRHAATLYAAGIPVVLAGDYNVVPTDADIYPNRSWKEDALVQPAPRALHADLLAQGWTDSIRKKNPREPMYTYWDYKRKSWERGAGLRIDHLLLNPVTLKRLVDAGVDKHVRGWEEASDHAPAWVVLR